MTAHGAAMLPSHPRIKSGDRAIADIQITNTALPYIEGGIATGGIYGTWISTAYLIGESCCGRHGRFDARRCRSPTLLVGRAARPPPRASTPAGRGPGSPAGSSKVGGTWRFLERHDEAGRAWHNPPDGRATIAADGRRQAPFWPFRHPRHGGFRARRRCISER